MAVFSSSRNSTGFTAAGITAAGITAAVNAEADCSESREASDASGVGNPSINNSRRRYLKQMAGVAGLSMAAGTAAAVCSGSHGVVASSLNSGAEALATPETVALPGTGLEVVFTGPGRLRVVNHHSQPVRLQRIYPATVGTRHGHYDLNRLFADGAREFNPGESAEIALPSNSELAAAGITPYHQSGEAVRTRGTGISVAVTTTPVSGTSGVAVTTRRLAWS